jgi:hypothetical protein
LSKEKRWMEEVLALQGLKHPNAKALANLPSLDYLKGKYAIGS